MRKGRFIVLDGVDGTGKSTQVRRLAAALRRRGLKVLTVVDPGDTPLGRDLRKVLLGSRKRIAANTEALLYCASRAQLVAERIRPALRKGWTVISDRYSTATLAYQGALGGLEGKGLEDICRFAEDGVRPDITLILDATPHRALDRRDRLEARGAAYQRRVRARFLALAGRDPRRIRVVSATGTPAEVTKRLLQEIR